MKSGKKLDLSLYLVLDANLCKTPEGMAETARKAVEGGCTVVQLRAPEWKKKKQLRNYHDSHGVEGWGDATTYDICISSSYFGIEETADFLCAYIEKRMAKLK